MSLIPKGHDKSELYKEALEQNRFSMQLTVGIFQNFLNKITIMVSVFIALAVTIGSFQIFYQKEQIDTAVKTAKETSDNITKQWKDMLNGRHVSDVSIKNALDDSDYVYSDASIDVDFSNDRLRIYTLNMKFMFRTSYSGSNTNELIGIYTKLDKQFDDLFYEQDDSVERRRYEVGAIEAMAPVTVVADQFYNFSRTYSRRALSCSHLESIANKLASMTDVGTITVRPIYADAAQPKNEKTFRIKTALAGNVFGCSDLESQGSKESLTEPLPTSDEPATK